MRIKTVGVFLAIAVIVMSLFGVRVESETIDWIHPTVYTDGSTIPAAKLQQFSTELQFRIGAGTWTTYGIATGGVTTYTAPYVTSPGSNSLWRARSISVGDNNSTSVWSPEVAYTRPFQSPAPPQPPVVR